MAKKRKTYKPKKGTLDHALEVGRKLKKLPPRTRKQASEDRKTLRVTRKISSILPRKK